MICLTYFIGARICPRRETERKLLRGLENPWKRSLGKKKKTRIEKDISLINKAIINCFKMTEPINCNFATKTKYKFLRYD